MKSFLIIIIVFYLDLKYKRNVSTQSYGFGNCWICFNKKAFSSANCSSSINKKLIYKSFESQIVDSGAIQVQIIKISNDPKPITFVIVEIIQKPDKSFFIFAKNAQNWSRFVRISNENFEHMKSLKLNATTLVSQ